MNHLGQVPSATISFNVQRGVALGDATARVRKAADEILPLTIPATFQGTAQVFQSSVGGLAFLLVIAILVIYLVLGILYESFIHPLTILSGLPSAGLGALVTLLLFGKDLNVYGFVGLIMLVGIVEKNAIMMIDFAIEAARAEGKGPAEAIRQAAIVRFRPIMMTTMAALMGTLPIALGIGAGRRVAPAARPRGRGRPPRLAGPHALPHAGRLHRVRLPAGEADARAAPGPAGGRRAGARHVSESGGLKPVQANVSGLFIRRPVMTTLVMAGLFLFGAIAYFSLPVADLPKVDFPTINVGASLPGREPGDDGGRRRDAARAAVLGHRRASTR